MNQIQRFLRYYYCKVFNQCEFGFYNNFTCGCEGEIQWESGRTAYHTTAKPNSFDDPNREVLLCRLHAEQHHEHWNDMWDQVPKG